MITTDKVVVTTIIAIIATVIVAPMHILGVKIVAAVAASVDIPAVNLTVKTFIAIVVVFYVYDIVR